MPRAAGSASRERKIERKKELDRQTDRTDRADKTHRHFSFSGNA